MYLSQQNAEDSSYITKILKCFCIKRNIKDFLKENKNDIKCLHGIRFISCSLIVLTHVFTTVFALSAAYGLDHEELFNSYGSYVSEFIIVVDTFFVLSGLLLIRNNTRKRSIRDVAEFIIKRYFRLIWWYTAIMLIIVFVLPRFGCGPMCDKYIQREGGACIKTWWLGLLMIGNYVELAQICYPITWYVYCDFHMSVIGIILLWIYQRSRRIAITCFIILTVLSALLPAIAIYDMPELMKFKIDFETFNTIRNSDNLSVIAMYSQTHNRAIPYVMGIMLGYIMSNYKEIPFGRIITKNSYVFLAVIVTGILSYPFISLSDNLKAALVLLIVRFGWALLICALIALCEYGKLPSIKGFLSWSMFAPLSKLTYGIYFIHFLILTTNMVSVRGRLHYNAYILAERFFGQLTMSAFISLFFLLFIEAPLNNLVQLFLKSVGKTQTKLNVQSNEDNNENKSNELTTEASQTEEKEKLQ
ncbi:nose resistant to fluoxetine protein 6-like [Papilio machaon]|uniref:nose resistant to fluoxetine protein 6-like n=1 Tax=Papilio machaon TaxID=76193 RepID=UPI001E663608|nr:nose resistant to fluoxetine protein 6-like [Papilio machaon]